MSKYRSVFNHACISINDSLTFYSIYMLFMHVGNLGGVAGGDIDANHHFDLGYNSNGLE